MHPPPAPNTQQLIQSERHRSRKRQTRDADLSMREVGVPHRATSADMSRETQQPRAPGRKCAGTSFVLLKVTCSPHPNPRTSGPRTD